MPFRKRADGSYVSPSGKIWTKKQVIAYHAGAFDHPPKKKSPAIGPKKRIIGASEN